LAAEDVAAVMGTFGKALGGAGAFVVGSDALIETLIQRARSYVYATAMPPPVAAALRESLTMVKQEAWRRERLFSLIQRFKLGVSELAVTVKPSEGPIQPVILGSPQEAERASAKLLARGFFVQAVRPPTVPAGSSRLRITLSAAHSEDQVDRLLEALASLSCRFA
jgi:8-amino-7-oxononanoate synthase